MTFLVVLDKDDMSIKRVIGVSLTAAVGMLTHYYFGIWLGLFSMGYLIYLVITIPGGLGKLRAAGTYMGTMMISLASTTLLFPKWIKNIFFDDGTKGHSCWMKIFGGAHTERVFSISV